MADCVWGKKRSCLEFIESFLVSFVVLCCFFHNLKSSKLQYTFFKPINVFLLKYGAFLSSRHFCRL